MPTLTPPVMGVPGVESEAPALQAPPGDVCQMCHKTPPDCIPNTSSRPSALEMTRGGPEASGLLASTVVHPLQGPLGAVSQLCHKPPSLLTTNNSSRESLFLPTTGAPRTPVAGAPSEAFKAANSLVPLSTPQPVQAFQPVLAG